MIKNAPLVYITLSAKEKLDLYIKHCDQEISGLGKVIRIGNDLLIEDIYLLEQEVTPASTSLSPTDLSKFLIKAINDGENPETFKLWWHSHVNMGVFWSATDDHTANLFRNGWMLSIVGNKLGSYRIRLDIFEPFRLVIDELEMRIYYPDDDQLSQGIKEEIQKKVKLSSHPLIGSFPYSQSWVQPGSKKTRTPRGKK